jgi:hypothetical protein
MHDASWMSLERRFDCNCFRLHPSKGGKRSACGTDKDVIIFVNNRLQNNFGVEELGRKLNSLPKLFITCYVSKAQVRLYTMQLVLHQDMYGHRSSIL